MENNYEVGYCKAPKGSQFKPGQSGNPKGRPRGTFNSDDLLKKILNEKIIVKQGGRERKISKKKAIFLQAVNKAVNGDLKAAAAILPLIYDLEAKQTENACKTASLNIDDKSLLKEWLERQK